MGNLMFDDDSEDEDSVYAYDWQLVARAKGAMDVAYFLSGNLSTENRRCSETELLAEYHGLLVDLGVRGYSYEEFSRDLRLSGFRLMHVATSGLVNLGDKSLSTEEGQNVLKALCSRLQTPIDWNCDEVIPK